jgi:hypothetical protein
MLRVVLMPMIWIIRFHIVTSTHKLISVLTLSVLVDRWVLPSGLERAGHTCSTVRRRIPMALVTGPVASACMTDAVLPAFDALHFLSRAAWPHYAWQALRVCVVDVAVMI